MKKLLLTMLTILTCGAAYALPTGNPADPALTPQGLFWNDECCEAPCDPCDPCGFDWDVSLRLGFYGDYVFNRKLQLNGPTDSRIDDFELFTNAGLIVLNFWERLDIYTTLGATNMALSTNALDFGLIGLGRLYLETESDFSWSVGVRGILWECGCTTVGLDARYFRTSPDIKRITVNETFSAYPEDLELEYREWQVSLGVSHRINMFVPYVAVQWSKVDVDFDGDPFLIPGITVAALSPRDLEERHQWGYAVGVSLVDCDIMTLNVEGRFRNEKAISVNAQIRF